MQFCLFVCLGKLQSASSFVLPWQPSSVPSSHSQPRQQPAIESVSLICLSGNDSEFPSEAAMTSQAARETDWWWSCSVLLLNAHCNSSNVLSEHWGLLAASCDGSHGLTKHRKPLSIQGTQITQLSIMVKNVPFGWCCMQLYVVHKDPWMG